MIRALGVAAVLLSGCGSDCPPPADLRVVDHDGGAPDGMVEHMQGVLDAFVAELEPSSLCVAEVRLADNARHPLKRVDPFGYYNKTTDNIVLDYSIEGASFEGLPRQYESVMEHELCHAVDSTWEIVDADPDPWADAEDVLPEEAIDFYSKRALPHEVFAERCSGLPLRDLDLWAGRTCGDLPRWREILEDEVYVASGARRAAEPVVEDLTLDVQSFRWDLPDGNGHAMSGARFAFGGLVLLSRSLSGDTEVDTFFMDLDTGVVERILVLPLVDVDPTIWGGADELLVYDDGRWTHWDRSGSPRRVPIKEEPRGAGVVMDGLAIGDFGTGGAYLLEGGDEGTLDGLTGERIEAIHIDGDELVVDLFRIGRRGPPTRLRDVETRGASYATGLGGGRFLGWVEVEAGSIPVLWTGEHWRVPEDPCGWVRVGDFGSHDGKAVSVRTRADGVDVEVIVLR